MYTLQWLNLYSIGRQSSRLSQMHIHLPAEIAVVHVLYMNCTYVYMYMYMCCMFGAQDAHHADSSISIVMVTYVSFKAHQLKTVGGICRRQRRLRFEMSSLADPSMLDLWLQMRSKNVIV